MKKIIAAAIFTGASVITLSSCTNTQVGTVAGGAAGAGLGYAVTGGSAGGAIIGGGAGALIGNQIGANQDRRYYYRTGWRNGYYAPYYRNVNWGNGYRNGYWGNGYWRNGAYFYY